MGVLLSAGVYVTLAAVLFQLVYITQPNPFIDEIFHIPQAQKYCSGKYLEVRIF